MKLIEPQTIAFTASVTENEIRKRMAMEVLEQIGGLMPNGEPAPGIEWKVNRGTGRNGGYTIHINGPAPARVFLPKQTEAIIPAAGDDA